MTIDEQVLAFRGSCLFRIYSPNKPAKYGIQIDLVCDVRSKYIIDVSPYFGGNASATVKEPLDSYYCKLLIKTIYRNLTADIWHISLLSFTIRSNKQTQAKASKNSSLLSTLYDRPSVDGVSERQVITQSDNETKSDVDTLIRGVVIQALVASPRALAALHILWNAECYAM